MASTGHADGVSGSITEYETATARWIERTVDFLMVESDSLYAQLRPEQIDGLGETAVRSGVGGEVLVKPVHTVATGSVDVGSAIAGDFGDLEAVVAEIAYQKLEQTMGAYFVLIMDATQHTGNVADARGDAAEGLLAVLEKMDIAFDDDGNPRDSDGGLADRRRTCARAVGCVHPRPAPKVLRDHHPQEGGIPCFAMSSQASSTLSLSASSTRRLSRCSQRAASPMCTSFTARSSSARTSSPRALSLSTAIPALGIPHHGSSTSSRSRVRPAISAWRSGELSGPRSTKHGSTTLPIPHLILSFPARPCS